MMGTHGNLCVSGRCVQGPCCYYYSDTTVVKRHANASYALSNKSVSMLSATMPQQVHFALGFLICCRQYKVYDMAADYSLLFTLPAANVAELKLGLHYLLLVVTTPTPQPMSECITSNSELAASPAVHLQVYAAANGQVGAWNSFVLSICWRMRCAFPSMQGPSCSKCSPACDASQSGAPGCASLRGPPCTLYCWAMLYLVCASACRSCPIMCSSCT